MRRRPNSHKQYKPVVVASSQTRLFVCLFVFSAISDLHTDTMAAIVRQPFAPLDGTRLQSLNGIKNVQNCQSFPALYRDSYFVFLD